jgi:Skp family chaperone for outer membrane proteins
MKKMLSAVAALLIVSSGFLAAKGEFVSIDSLMIMQKSQEGKELINSMQKDVEKFQNDLKKSQQDLASLQESISKQAKVLSKEAMADKSEEIVNKRKQLERQFADKEEALKLSFQRRQMALREHQLAVVNEVFEKESWAAVIDKNTPGLLCVASGIDRTDMVLAAVDQKYTAGKGKSAKPAASVKTAANTTTVSTVKPTVKSA